MPAVFAIVADDTVASAYADATGKFLIRGVPEGTYTVGFSPKAGFDPWHIDNVFVVTGNVTDLGTVTVIP